MPSYTLNELIKMMEPQAQRDKALINQCVIGLSLYAAQQAQANSFSSKPDEMRKLIENLVGYWGLDDGEHTPSQEDILESFDNQVFDAKSGALIADGTYRSHADTIYGLHRYGEEMVVAQGSDAMSEILDMGDLMKEIALYWEFEPYDTVAGLADRLRAEVRSMLADITLPGQPVSGENVRYQIQQAILFNNDRGFVLAHNPNAPSPYVTWAFTDRDGKRGYDAGYYYSTEERAKLSYLSRVAGYIESYKVTEKPVPTAAVEMSEEQNYNMIDGIINNEAPDSSSNIPVQVITEGQPLVTVTFSELDQLRGVEKMPLYLADALFAELDAKPREVRSVDGAPYHKTDFRIDYIWNGEFDTYLGHYDVGDGGGSLIDHIQAYAEYGQSNEGYQQYLADKNEQEAVNTELTAVLNDLVPFLRMHCKLSEMEAAAVSELMGIHEAAAGDPSDSAEVRIEYLEAVVEHASRSRAALNNTGLGGLPELPQPVAEVVKDQHRRGDKQSVLEQIKAARTAPKRSPKPKQEHKKNPQGPEL